MSNRILWKSGMLITYINIVTKNSQQHEKCMYTESLTFFPLKFMYIYAICFPIFSTMLKFFVVCICDGLRERFFLSFNVMVLHTKNIFTRIRKNATIIRKNKKNFCLVKNKVSNILFIFLNLYVWTLVPINSTFNCISFFIRL